MFKKLLVAAALVAAAVAVIPTTSNAASITYTATTKISNRLDSGGSGANWATDTLTRVLTIKQVTATTFTATVQDTGTFVTIAAAKTPNQSGGYVGTRVKNVVSGAIHGYASYSFTASKLPTVKLPATMSGNAKTTGDWYKQAFVAGTVFGGTGMNNDWIWDYTTTAQSSKVGNVHVSLPEFWVDSATNDAGQRLAAGQINGYNSCC